MSWTDERVGRLSTLWLEGLSASQIAADLGGGVSRNAVIGKVHRLGLSGRILPAAAPPEPHAVERLAPEAPVAEVLAADLPEASSDLPAPSAVPVDAPPAAPEPVLAAEDPAPAAAEIDAAPSLDVLPPAPPVEVAESAPAPEVVPLHAGAVPVLALQPIAFDLPALRSAREVALPLSDRVTLLELGATMCRWPIGDPTKAEFRFCGCRAVSTLPYCQEHARVAFQPVADRRRVERMIRIA